MALRISITIRLTINFVLATKEVLNTKTLLRLVESLKDTKTVCLASLQKTRILSSKLRVSLNMINLQRNLIVQMYDLSSKANWEGDYEKT